ncbi:GNAT family N-acetyltransferase [Deinococcus sp. AJ005]|uniref:GNAT family N-acetyltransferase n=1 Tax=Deinococcus sp. AJ005 TaxID=2652443 RepID=UPI00125CB740|nr:GNAT family N-acetyltransferase [Deinococcus sp. AJ005]QFP76409.1 N-acetyltransferase [Deinococcus sp. AJ005]
MEPTASPPLPGFPDLQLLECSAADFPHLAAFLSAAHPDAPTSAEDLERLAAGRMLGETHRQLLALRGGEIVGLAETGVPRMDGHPGWLEVRIRTRSEEVGGALPGELLKLAEADAVAQGAGTLVSHVHEDWWEHDFLLARGYAEHDRMWNSTLNLQALDFTRFAGSQARVAAAGLTIQPLSELGGFGEVQQRRFYTLVATLLNDVPSTTPVSVWPFEVWQRRAGVKVLPEGVFIALAPNGEWVGLSELYLPIATRPGTLHNGLTGVLKPWRGQGIALALKLAAARAALERGFTHSRTGNHSINIPMLAVNERLGFVREGARATLRKEV